MKCSTDDLTQIYGNYDTYTTQNLMVVFEKCTNSTDSNEIVCRSEDEIKNWIESKYILTLSN